LVHPIRIRPTGRRSALGPLRLTPRSPCSACQPPGLLWVLDPDRSRLGYGPPAAGRLRTSTLSRCSPDTALQPPGRARACRPCFSRFGYGPTAAGPRLCPSPPARMLLLLTRSGWQLTRVRRLGVSTAHSAESARGTAAPGAHASPAGPPPRGASAGFARSPSPHSAPVASTEPARVRGDSGTL
jgi:hypothetical protein